jgi:MFS transporter, NRE family, putaive nickel resistance protein
MSAPAPAGEPSAHGQPRPEPGLWSNRDFVRLFAAQATSLVGSGITSVALAAFAYRIAGANATVVVGTALTLRILAFVLLSPLAGVVADRVDRRTLLVTADVLRVGLLGLFPFVHTTAQIYALIFAVNAVTAFFTPTFEASLPEVVGPTHYTRAISLSRVTLALEAALGPALAGLLIATVGLRWTFWADAATYAISAALVLLSIVPRAARPEGPFPWGSFVPEVTHGTRVLLREPALRKALLLHLAEAAAGAVAIVTTVAYVRDELGRGDAAFAAAMAAVGVGSSAAALLLPAREARARRGGAGVLEGHLRFHGWAERTLVLGGAALTVALLPGILRPGLLVLFLLWALNGAGQSLVAIPSTALLAEHTAPEERGRAYAAHFALTHLFWLATYPASGYLARAIGTPRTFAAAGVLCAVLTLAAAAIRPGHRHHPLDTGA